MTPTENPTAIDRGFLTRSAQIILPCVVFVVVLLAFETPLIYVLPMLLFFVFAFVWETKRPLLAPQLSTWKRWPANGVLWAISIVIGSKLGQACILLAASFNVSYGSGWLTRNFDSLLFIALISILILDVWHYLLHRLMHRWDWLWRIHRVHHSDRDFDVTTGLRFHPLEGAIATVWNLVPMLALGMPWYALMANAVLILTVNYFTHANAQLGPKAERVVRVLLITPTLHRVHHSLLEEEGRYNYSTIFSFWDRMFGTLQLRSAQTGAAPQTGVEGISAAQSQSVVQTLLMPFKRYVAVSEKSD